MDINKYKFYKKTKFLEIIIEVNDVQMNSERFKIILKWETPQTVKQIQTFIELCNYY